MFWNKDDGFSDYFKQIKKAFASARLGLDEAWKIRTDAAKYGGGVDDSIVEQSSRKNQAVYLKLAKTLESIANELKKDAAKAEKYANQYKWK